MIGVGSSQRTEIVWLKFRFTWCLLGVARRARRWVSDMPSRSKGPADPASIARGPLRWDAEHLADLGDGTLGEVVVVDLEQVDAVAARHTTLPRRIASAIRRCMPGAWMLRSRTSRSKKPVVGMYPVSKSPINVASHAKPFGSGSARPMNAKTSSSPLRFVP